MPEPSPGTALIPTTHSGRLRLGGSGALSEATQLVSGTVIRAHALGRGAAGRGYAGVPPHTHLRELWLYCFCTQHQVLLQLRVGVGKGP